MGARHAEDPGSGLAQRVLAETVVRRLRGPEGLAQAQTAARLMFGPSRVVPGATGAGEEAIAAAPAAASASAAQLLGLADSGQVPSVSLPLAAVVGRPLVEVAAAAGAVASKSEARRLIAGRGLSLSLGEGGAVTDPALIVGWPHLCSEGGEGVAARAVLVLRCGKKRTVLVVVGAAEGGAVQPDPPRA